MVMFLKRPGDQSQFSAFLTAEAVNRQDIGELQAWIVANPGADLSVEALAERVAMSPRNFALSFPKTRMRQSGVNLHVPISRCKS